MALEFDLKCIQNGIWVCPGLTAVSEPTWCTSQFYFLQDFIAGVIWWYENIMQQKLLNN